MKVTDNNPDKTENEFDLGKKEEEIPESDDEEYGEEEDSPQKVGDKRKAEPAKDSGPKKKAKK